MTSDGIAPGEYETLVPRKVTTVWEEWTLGRSYLGGCIVGLKHDKASNSTFSFINNEERLIPEFPHRGFIFLIVVDKDNL